ncbi:hypothetical protein VPH35_112485 [Triticum aestivum]
MVWMSWDKLRLPKAMGGMGFRDMRAFNQALLAKQAWRLLDRPDRLCACLLKARYYPSGQLLDTVFPGSGSEVWKGILHGLELVKKGVIWRVGNGVKIHTWHDPWLPRPYSFRPITPKEICLFNRVSDFLDGNGAWKQDRLREFFWPMDIDHILKIKTSPRQRDDFLAWYPEKRGGLTVRSAYKLATCDHNVVAANGASSTAPEGNRGVELRLAERGTTENENPCMEMCDRDVGNIEL